MTWFVFLSDLLTPFPTYSKHIQFTTGKKYALRRQSVSLSIFTEQWLYLIVELNRKIWPFGINQSIQFGFVKTTRL